MTAYFLERNIHTDKGRVQVIYPFYSFYMNVTSFSRIVVVQYAHSDLLRVFYSKSFHHTLNRGTYNFLSHQFLDETIKGEKDSFVQRELDIFNIQQTVRYAFIINIIWGREQEERKREGGKTQSQKYRKFSFSCLLDPSFHCKSVQMNGLSSPAVRHYFSSQ